MRKSARSCAAVLFFAVVPIYAEGSDHRSSGLIARSAARAADDQSLTITVGGLDQRVPRADILQVFGPSGTHRERHKNIVMAIGAVSAGIVMAHRCRFENTACNEEAMLYYLPLIATGDILGGWVPKGTRWRQIYGRPAP
jgi:hypothetical protein